MLHNMLQDFDACVGPLLCAVVLPPSASGNVLDTVDARKRPSYVSAWGQFIAVDRCGSEHGIV